MSVEENKERLDRHEAVIEKLIKKVMQLEVGANIQNFINEVNSGSTKKNISDSTLGS